MTLRLANESDRHDCLRMARLFHSKSPYSNQEFSVEKCNEIFDRYLAGGGKDLIFILAEDVNPYGMIIGIRSELPFSKSVVCTELAWWVDEDKRGRESLLLFKAYEEWSRRVGGDLNAVAMLEGVTDLGDFYTRQGYSPAEKTYIKEV